MARIMNENDVLDMLSSPAMVVPEGFIWETNYSWRNIYIRMLRRQRSLAEAYNRPRVDIATLMDAVDSFFLDCNHLVDWMKSDTASPQALPPRVRSQVESRRGKNEELLIAQAFANVSKHQQRTTSTQPTAQVQGWKPLQGQTPRVTVLIESTVRGKSKTQDALLLANRCVLLWASFLRMHKVDEPVLD